MESRRPDRDTLERLYVTESLTATAIAAQLGMRASTVYAWLTKYQIPRRRPCEYAGKALSREQVESVWTDRFSIDQAANQLGVSKQTLRRRASEYNLGRKPVKACDMKSPAAKRLKPNPASPLWELYFASGSITDRNAIAERYGATVHLIAKRLHQRLPRSVQLDDLIQFGTMGLLEAVETYDPRRGVKFETFAGHRIRGYMLDGLRNTANRPRLMIDRAKRIDITEQELQGELSRPPTPEETAGALGITAAEYIGRCRHRRDTPMDQAEERTGYKPVPIKDVLSQPGPDVPEVVAAKLFAEQVIGWALDNRRLTDALLLKLYYLDSLTFNEIGEVFSVSESGVSQRHANLIAAARARFTAAAA